MNPQLKSIAEIVGRLRRRLRFQRGFRWLVRALVVGAVVAVLAVVCHHLHWLAPSWWPVMGYSIAGGVLLAFIGGVLGRYDSVLLAQRLDRVHGLKDRLGTAVSLAHIPPDELTPFHEAQAQDAVKRSREVSFGRAAPWAFPMESLAVVAFIGLAWVAAWYWPVAWTPTQEAAGVEVVALTVPPPAAEAPPRVLLDPEELEALQQRLDENQEELATLAENDPEMERFIEKMNRVLEKIVEGKLTHREVAEQTAELEEQADALVGEAQDLQKQEELAEKFDQLAKHIEKEAKKLKQDDLKELAKLLEERKYEKASQLFEKLLEKFAKLPPKEQRRLAKAFENLAKKLQSRFSKQLEKLQKKQSRLARKNPQDSSPNAKNKRRLNRLQKKLDKLQRRYDQSTGEAQKELDKLSRAMKDMAQRLRRQPPQKRKKGQGQSENQPKAAEKSNRMDPKTLKELTEALRRLGKKQRRSRLGKMGKMRMADLKELLKRRRGQGQKKERSRLARLRRGRLEKLGQGQQGDGAGKEGGLQRKGLEWVRVKRGKDRGPITKKQAQIGEGIGQGHHPLNHRRGTEVRNAKMRPDFVPAQRRKGRSKVEVLYGAATEGTQVKGYGDVHIDFSMRASRQMAQEEVPPGYRQIVEKYFQLIRK